ncbi:response regulator [Sulfitobacter sp. LCG007]
MLAYVGLGTISGLLAFAGGLIAGHSFLISLLIYSGVGSGVTVLTAVADTMRREYLAHRKTVADKPRSAAEVINLADSSPISDVRSDELRILAVDDDPFIRDLIPMITSKAGHTNVVTAGSGEEALKLLGHGTKREFDCFLFDICMPEMDGVELCSRIRDLPVYDDVPVIMLTAMREKSSLDRAYSAGATDYVKKPFEISVLARKLDEALKVSEVRQEGGALVADVAADPARTGAVGPTDAMKGGRIEGVDNLVEMKQLENYLCSLSKAAFRNCQIVAVSLTDSTENQSAASQRNLLRRTAEAINDAFGQNHGLMTHAGEGTFIVVTSPAWFASAEELEGAFWEYFEPPSKKTVMGRNSDIRFTSGDPFCPSPADVNTPGKVLGRALDQLRKKGTQGGPGARSANILKFG